MMFWGKVLKAIFNKIFLKPLFLEIKRFRFFLENFQARSAQRFRIFQMLSALASRQKKAGISKIVFCWYYSWVHSKEMFSKCNLIFSKLLKIDCRSNLADSRDTSPKTFFYILGLECGLKLSIWPIPLVPEAHFRISTAIFLKIVKKSWNLQILPFLQI